ncbi:MAG TPA: metallophosphatase [Pseudobacteroides sp.]|uniref:bifunctional metallophosphatase/5'-nucleotidase n=1 Tax=Pseudobacteroides sp. TaxID=1968840 RepID=UPI002F9491A4
MLKRFKLFNCGFILVLFVLSLALTSCNSGTSEKTLRTPTIGKATIDTATEPTGHSASKPAVIPSTYSLTILSTNDIHGHIETLPEYATIVKQVRSERKNVLLLDAGDVFKRGKYENYQGKIEMDIYNEMGYDAMVLGNNEFKVPGSKKSKKNSGTLEDSDKQISSLIKWAQFPILCGNVKLKDTNKYIDGTKPYTVIDVNEVKVGIIGVTSTAPKEEKLDMTVNKDFISPQKAVKQLLPEVKRVSDIQIVLSHAGMSNDKKVKDVSAIIGGHDHIRTLKPVVSNGIPIMQAGGEELHYLGRVDLEFKQKDNNWVLDSFSTNLYPADGIVKDERIKRIIDDYRKRPIPTLNVK